MSIKIVIADDHEIFRDDFKPVHHGFLLEDVLVVRDTQSNSHTIIGISIEAVCRHNNLSNWKQENGGPELAPALPCRENPS